jgi:hypothetical protein
LTLDGLQRAQQAAAAVFVGPEVHGYLLDLAQATRIDQRMAPGVSPRGSLVWQRVSQAWAFLEGRDYVSPDDVQHTARAVLGVRLAGGQADVATLVAELLEKTPVPDVVNDPAGASASARKPPIVSALLAVLMLVGCGKIETTGSEASVRTATRTDAAQATYEEHDHHIPEHKPSSFPDGVAALIRRHGELRERLTNGRLTDLASRFQESCDIRRLAPDIGRRW